MGRNSCGRSPGAVREEHVAKALGCAHAGSPPRASSPLRARKSAASHCRRTTAKATFPSLSLSLSQRHVNPILCTTTQCQQAKKQCRSRLTSLEPFRKPHNFFQNSAWSVPNAHNIFTLHSTFLAPIITIEKNTESVPFLTSATFLSLKQSRNRPALRMKTSRPGGASSLRTTRIRSCLNLHIRTRTFCSITRPPPPYTLLRSRARERHTSSMKVGGDVVIGPPRPCQSGRGPGPV